VGGLLSGGADGAGRGQPGAGISHTRALQLSQELDRGKTHLQHTVRALDWFFNKPIFKTSDFMKTAGIPQPTANRIVQEVRDAGLLIEMHPASGRPCWLSVNC